MPRLSRIVGWLAALLCALPLLVCIPAPLTDWPNHIARVWIGVRLLHDDPLWMQYYTLNPRLVPNLALDLGIGALHFAGLDVDAAAAIFLVAAFGIFVFGFTRFARAMGTDDDSKPMLGGILFLTGPLMYGLVNYVLGIGMALWAVAMWSGCSRNAPRRWFLAVVGTAVLFPIHLLASAIFMIVAGCMDAWSWRAARPRNVSQLACSSSSLGSACVFLLLLLTSPTSGDSMPRADGSNLWFPGHDHIIATLWWKGGIFVRMFADHATVSAAVVTLIGLAVAFACVALAGREHPVATASTTLRGGAWFAVVVLLAIVLVLPESLGTGSLLDYRVALAPLAIAAATTHTGLMRAAARRIAFGAVAVVCLGRSLSFAADFRDEQAVFRSIEAAAARLPPGGIVLSARGLADEDIPQRVWWSPPLEHGASRAVFAGQFVPTVFAVASQQPVVLRPEFAQWRRSWRIASESEIDVFARDATPLCGTDTAWPGPVTLFIAYPGRWRAPAAAVVASGNRWSFADACRIMRIQE